MSHYKPYPAYKDSGVEWIGQMPEHWIVAPLKRNFKIVGGSTPKSEQEAYWDGEIVWVTPSDLSKLSSIGISNSQRKITTEGLVSCGTTLVPSGSIVLSTRAPIGSLAIAETELCTNQGCKSLVPFADTQSHFYGYLLSISTGELNIRGKGTTFLELSGDELRTFKLGVPPKTEQQTIAAFLDRETARIDALITKKTRFIELLKEKRSALITHAVTKGIAPNAKMRDSGVEWIREVPEHWDVMRLRHVALFKNSNVDKKAYDGQEAVSLCNYTDVYYNEFITPNLPFMQATASAAEVEQFSLKKGDVLITKDSEDPTDIGIPSLVAEEMPGVVCGYHLTMIRGDDFDTARLLHRILQSHPTQAHFFVEAPGITRYGLSQDAIGDLRCCLPPKNERSQIADHLDRETARIDTIIAKTQHSIDLLKERRSAFISAAVTGQIDLREAA